MNFKEIFKPIEPEELKRRVIERERKARELAFKEEMRKKRAEIMPVDAVVKLRDMGIFDCYITEPMYEFVRDIEHTKLYDFMAGSYLNKDGYEFCLYVSSLHLKYADRILSNLDVLEKVGISVTPEIIDNLDSVVSDSLLAGSDEDKLFAKLLKEEEDESGSVDSEEGFKEAVAEVLKKLDDYEIPVEFQGETPDLELYKYIEAGGFFYDSHNDDWYCREGISVYWFKIDHRGAEGPEGQLKEKSGFVIYRDNSMEIIAVRLDDGGCIGDYAREFVYNEFVDFIWYEDRGDEDFLKSTFGILIDDVRFFFREYWNAYVITKEVVAADKVVEYLNEKFGESERFNQLLNLEGQDLYNAFYAVEKGKGVKGQLKFDGTVEESIKTR